MAQVHLPLAPQRGFGETSRTDTWWLEPMITGLAFAVCIGWMTFAGLHYGMEGGAAAYYHGGYLSPAYSPEIWGPSHHAIFRLPQGTLAPAWWPDIPLMPFSPAVLILIIPAGFRLTCYYYRGFYYKSYWMSPPACAVGKPHNSYSGERSFPLIIHNLHRYLMYLAVAYLFVLAHDAYKGMFFESVPGSENFDTFGVGVGTLVLLLNVIFLSSYTIGCHCFRHVSGGFLDRISTAPMRKKLYELSSFLNRNHMRAAWVSLLWVTFTDVYVRMCALGIWTDWRIL